MNNIILSILPIFLVIASGSFLKIFKIADERWVSALNSFSYYIAFPALIINSFISARGGLNTGLFFGNAIIMLIVSAVLYAILRIMRIRKETANAYLVCGVFGNFAYLGFPFITSVLPGTETDVSLVIASSLLVLFSAVLIALEFSKTNKLHLDMLKNLLANPLLISVAIGFFFFRFGVSFPAPLHKAIIMLANSASPVALVSIGVFLVRKITLRDAFFKTAPLIILKLAVIPFLFYLLRPGNIDFTIPILESAMPVAITPFVLAEKYPMDKDLVLQGIVLTTILSVLTLPVASYLLGL